MEIVPDDLSLTVVFNSGMQMEKTIAVLKERLEKQQKEAAEIKTEFNLQ
jgi:hypothetical protein